MEKLNESYEIIDNNIFVDFDKFKSGKNNVCLITGLSGSGKTTLATDLSYMHNATVVSLDNFYNIKKIGKRLEEYDPVLYSYLSTRKDLWKKLVERKLTGNNYNREVDNYLQYCIEYCKKNKHKKYIIEGVQLYCLMNGGDLKGCSLICINTSAFKSAINRVKRINRINKKNGCRLIDRLIDAIQCGKIDKDAIRCYDEFKDEVLSSQEEKQVNESYLFSKDDLYINFDKFESGKCNICLITGLSGSGKSTLGRELSKKYDAEYVELDKFFLLGSGIKNISKTFDPFFKKYSKLYKELESAKYINDEQFPITLMNNILNYCKSFKNKKFIIEGVQIFTYQNEELKKYPIIIKNTSALISMKRMILRDREDILEPDENGKKHYTNYVKDLPKFLKYYIDDERELRKFRKAITESIEVEPLEETMVDNNPKYNEEDLTDHHGVGVVLLNEDMEILMLDHVKLNTEVFPVGKVKKGESVFEGMCNELFEETNLKINSAYEVVEFVLDIIRNGKKITQTNHIFICRDYSGNIKNKEPKKHRDVYFIPFEEMMKKNQNSYMVNVFKDAYRKGYIVLTENTTNCMIDRQSSVDEMIYRTKFVKHVRKGNKYV